MEGGRSRGDRGWKIKMKRGMRERKKRKRS